MDRTDQNFTDTIAHTATEISRTDTKAGLILTLDGLLVAALSFLGTELHGLALVLAVAGAVALVTGVVLAMIVIRPRLTAPGGGDDDQASFVYFATAGPADITAAMAEDRRLARIQVLSAIAHRKMLHLRYAGDASLAAVITIAAAILTR